MSADPRGPRQGNHDARGAPTTTLVLLACLVACVAACSPPAPAPTKSPKVAMEPCAPPAGIRTPRLPSRSRCGELAVPEDPARPEGRKIPLRIARVPALDPDATGAPLLILVGGPGQAATEAGAHLLGAFEELRQAHDLLFVDQRGTGASNPLGCEWKRPDPFGSDEALEELFRVDPPVDLLGRCRDDWDADLRFYTTPLAADDLAAVLDALGLERVNVYGVSYGTRLALELARRHPARVRALVLDAVAPQDIQLPMNVAKGGAQALARAVEDCQASAACRGAYPELRQDLERLRQGLLAEPRRITVAHPQSGRRGQVLVQWPLVARLLYTAMMSDELRALVPLAIHRASRDDLGALAAITDALGASQDQISYGLHLAVTCSEDLRRIPAVDRARAIAEDPHGVAAMALEQYDAMCALFPEAPLPEDYVSPPRLDTPTLLLSGELDPVTPPPWGEATQARLATSQHIIVPGTGHGCWRHGCVVGLMARFFAGSPPGQSGPLDPEACLETIHAQPFFLSNAGPIGAPEKPPRPEEAP